MRFGETRLAAGFTVLLVLMLAVGLAGIWKIQSLSKIIGELGQRNLAIEKSVLEMKINNTLYAMAVRNSVLWQTSKYLGAVSGAAGQDAITRAQENFDRQLHIYAGYIQSDEQKEWLERLSESVRQLRNLGGRITALAEKESGSQEVARLSLVFENNFYKINEFLDETFAMANLQEINRQISLGYQRKKEAILLLSWSLVLSLFIGAATAGWVYLRRKQERAHKEEMVRLIITSEERQRQNISAQIHDQMAQDLSALKIYTGVIEQTVVSVPAASELKDKVAQMKKILTGLMDRTHSICLLLRPPELDELGLADSIEGLILEYKRLADFNYAFEKPKGELKLPAEASLFLYRLTQEALTNALKHARAKNINIKLVSQEKKIDYQFSDDGIGFDFHQSLLRRRRREDKIKLGLLGLQERAELLGGVMRIESSPGKGTRISVQLSV
ncbi:MAG: ATP-binding protein [Candidatus Omnitrophica bacterium]|nr:ATP-binding protein [Candidatus Omnitrophota bacterium]